MGPDTSTGFQNPVGPPLESPWNGPSAFWNNPHQMLPLMEVFQEGASSASTSPTFEWRELSRWRSRKQSMEIALATAQRPSALEIPSAWLLSHPVLLGPLAARSCSSDSSASWLVMMMTVLVDAFRRRLWPACSAFCQLQLLLRCSFFACLPLKSSVVSVMVSVSCGFRVCGSSQRCHLDQLSLCAEILVCGSCLPLYTHGLRRDFLEKHWSCLPCLELQLYLHGTHWWLL